VLAITIIRRNRNDHPPQPPLSPQTDPLIKLPPTRQPNEKSGAAPKPWTLFLSLLALPGDTFPYQ
jgi:hypothetical protein